MPDSLEVRKVLTDFVPPSVFMLSAFERGPRSFNHLRLSRLGSEMAEEDGNLERILEVRVSDVEPVEGFRVRKRRVY